MQIHSQDRLDPSISENDYEMASRLGLNQGPSGMKRELKTDGHQHELWYIQTLFGNRQWKNSCSLPCTVMAVGRRDSNQRKSAFKRYCRSSFKATTPKNYVKVMIQRPEFLSLSLPHKLHSGRDASPSGGCPRNRCHVYCVQN